MTGGARDQMSSAELYDPATETWTAINGMKQIRFDHTASVLANGKVLIAGGYIVEVLDSAELYDPFTESWIATANMNHIRTDHVAFVLVNGKVLVAGGYDIYGHECRRTL